MRIVIAFAFITLVFLQVKAQGIEGRIVDTNSSGIPYVNIGVKDSRIGTNSDENGFFSLELEDGSYKLIISSVGYDRHEQTVTVSGKTHLDPIVLMENSLGLNEVVVTGTQYETYLKSSPVKVEVVTSEYLMKNFAPTNLVEGISMINGVQEVVACGVCYTNSISINGLPGPYTAVLMDGTPIYGSLAATYGLNGIPTSIIDRFEVIKGPSSTLYGSEAVAGVINIITKDPDEHPLFSLDIMGTSHLESFGNIAFSPRSGKHRGYVGINYAYINDFDDDNADGFGDMASLDRISLFSRWNINRKSGKLFTITGKLYFEDRRNGVEEFLKDRAYRELRGDDTVYGESIYTYRSELFGKYEFGSGFNLDYSFSHHEQDSYYGADHYRAEQSILFGNFTWRKDLENHRLLTGLTLRSQLYDDNTVATELTDGSNYPDNQFTPGLFVQDEWIVSKKVTLLSGLRADFHRDYQLEWSPRFSVKYNPWPYTTFRLNTGTGFKLVNLFTEDHAFVTGQRQVVIEEELRPEESYNITLNANHAFVLGESQGMFDLDLYYTHFSNKIIPDYDTPGQIIYRNIDGTAETKGISANLTQQWVNGLGLVAGATFQRAVEISDEGKRAIEFAPDWSGVFTLNYLWRKADITLAYTANISGPMQLPEVYDLDENGNPFGSPRPTRSVPFSMQNFQVQKQFNAETSVYVGVQNLFNYQQELSPLVGYNDPNFSSGFSPYFDTSYSFSPLHGREFYLGIRWNPGK